MSDCMTNLVEEQFETKDEFKATINEWLKLGDFADKFNKYSENNYIVVFDDSPEKFSLNKMPAKEQGREKYKKILQTSLKRDSALDDLPFNRIRSVLTTYKVDADINKFKEEKKH